MKPHKDAAPFAIAAIAGMALWFVAVAVTRIKVARLIYSDCFARQLA